MTVDIESMPRLSAADQDARLRDRLPQEVRRCCDLSGSDPDLLVALHRRFGCGIDLVALPDSGDLSGIGGDWPEDLRRRLVSEGVPHDRIRVVEHRDDLGQYDVVCALGSFSATVPVQGIAPFLDAAAAPSARVFVDIRAGSGGFAYFKRRGTTEALDGWVLDGRTVKRSLVTLGDRAAPPRATGPAPSSASAQWSEIAPSLVGDDGFHESNDHHSFSFIPRSDVLCVTFDNLDIAMKNRADRRPWGFSFIEKQGWSMLGVMANGWTWYRDPWVFERFDRLRDTGFFRRFRRVIFYGASMGGYGALAFSAASPGAQVVAFSPQTTLDKQVVPWETRYKTAWGYDYGGPYGDAARMTAAAERVNVFYDPYMPLDRGHIDRLSGDNLVHLRCPFLGHRLGSMLQQIGILQPLVLGAMAGSLTTADLARTLRARRSFRRYRLELLQHLRDRNHPALAARLCHYALRDGEDQAFRKALAELEDPARSAGTG